MRRSAASIADFFKRPPIWEGSKSLVIFSAKKLSLLAIMRSRIFPRQLSKEITLYDLGAALSSLPLLKIAPVACR